MLSLRYNKQRNLIKDAMHQIIWQVFDRIPMLIVLGSQAEKDKIYLEIMRYRIIIFCLILLENIIPALHYIAFLIYLHVLQFQPYNLWLYVLQ